MNITEIRIRHIDKEDSKLKAVAQITIDECFVVHDIKVIEGKDGLFISMPSKKAPDGTHIDIAHPIKTEIREMLNTRIIEAYHNTPRA